MTNYPRFYPGQRVRDANGYTHLVLLQQGCEVIMSDGTRWHATKVSPVAFT